MNIELKTKLMNMGSDDIVIGLKKLVTDERKLKTEILHYLWVVQQKRIFAKLCHPSLFMFCTKHLGYTEAEAQRRISATRLLGELPEIDQKINDGSLSLSSLSMAQSLFRQEAKVNQSLTKDKKIEVLQALENKSVRECEKEILKFSSQPIGPQEKIKPISDDLVQISFSAPKEFAEKLDRLKALNSHKNPHASTYEILNSLLEAALNKRSQRKQTQKQNSTNHDKAKQDSRRSVSFAEQVDQTKKSQESVSAQTKRNLWLKYEDRCCYRDPVTNQRCNSRYFLEIEHSKPRAHGGTNNEENLKLYCKAHNQFSAINEFGFEHMDKFINPQPH